MPNEGDANIGQPRVPPVETFQQPLGSVAYTVIAFLSLAVTLLVAYGLYLANQNAASSPLLRFFYYLLLWILGITSALFLFGVLRSSAALSGKQWGTAVDLGGPVVIGILVVAGGYKFSQLPETFTLTVRLNGSFPIQEMASGAKLWVDLNGRREHDDFGPNGQLVIMEVPSTFLTDPIPVTFESDAFRASDKGNSVKLHVPENHVAELNLVKISQSEKRREQLADKYSKILDDVSLELSRKKAFLFPAIDDYVNHPTPEKWQAVTQAAQDSLIRIQESMNEEVEYQSQERLLSIAQEASRAVASGNSLPRNAQGYETFDTAIVTHGLRAQALRQIPAGTLPDVNAVRAWEVQIEELYKRMETELTHLVAELRD